MWTSRLSLTNCMSGTGKQKMLRKFELAAAFVLEYCELELVIVSGGPGCCRFYIINVRSACFSDYFWVWFCFFL